MNIEKTIIVYAKDSVFKFPRLFETHTYFIDGDHSLTIYKRNTVNGEQTECAIFKSWDYLLIEADGDEYS